MKKSSGLIRGLSLFLLLLAAAAVVYVLSGQREVEDVAALLDSSRRAMRRAEFEQAEDFAVAALDAEPGNAQALLLAAEAATRRERLDEAVGYYKRIPADSPEAATAAWAMGDLLLFLGRGAEAEAAFRESLRRTPANVRANGQLATLLGIQGRRWESLPFLLRLVRDETADFDQLLYLSNLENNVDEDQSERLLRDDAADETALIARSRALMAEDRNAEAEQLLRRVLRTTPKQVEAQARLGLLLVGRRDDFTAWVRQLEQLRSLRPHPDLWLAMGLQARELGQRTAAIRCFGEALRLDADNPTANYQLGQSLVENGEAQAGQPFLNRERELGELLVLINKVAADRQNPELLAGVASAMVELGRWWEARMWYRFLASVAPQSDAIARARDLTTQLEDVPPGNSRTVPAHQLIGALDVLRHPLPRWAQETSPRAGPQLTAGENRVRFDDVGEAVGVRFSYFNSGDPDVEGRLMYEYSGGGVGVIDFDQDQWPDLYFTQGCPWPPRSGAGTHTNRLFRNQGDGRFTEVSAAAGTDDHGFGQGVAIGDIDNDGFPDIYVANIGRNRLLRNNGDGTFADISDSLVDPRGTWTTSCLIADLNGDAAPDLYDVNYLTGPDVFSKRCPWGSDRLRSCTPLQFPGEQDQVYANGGSGRFVRRTSEWGFEVSDGKGLGLLAADLDGSGTIDLFVANDMVPNSCFFNLAERGGTTAFNEMGLPGGLAVDRDGRVQGCMGIAAGDADGDGALDLFVTNFYDESNTLYLRRPDGLFGDRTRAAGLRQPGFKLLGFGTQFLDGELDGWPDLVVTNGHIDDFSFEGKPHEMEPHYYRNLGGARFEHVVGERAGAFFGGKYLGRGLARVDWNRDGLEEFAVSHLDAPSALLQNVTDAAGHFVAISLVGTGSDRDAIGATIEVRSGERTLTRQLTAGDGYQASNQRTLIFGLGEGASSVAVEVRWPSGLRQSFPTVPCDTGVLIVEGREQVWPAAF